MAKEETRENSCRPGSRAERHCEVIPVLPNLFLKALIHCAVSQQLVSRCSSRYSFESCRGWVLHCRTSSATCSISWSLCRHLGWVSYSELLERDVRMRFSRNTSKLRDKLLQSVGKSRREFWLKGAVTRATNRATCRATLLRCKL